MNALPVIEKAIQTRTPIRFEYIREGKTPGERIGNPHAAYIRRLQSGEEREYLHLWQTDGVTDSDQELPSWRTFFLNDLHNVALVTAGAPFDVADRYNPNYYEYPIAKI